jgi:hypothetical protein
MMNDYIDAANINDIIDLALEDFNNSDKDQLLELRALFAEYIQSIDNKLAKLNFGGEA